jgi:hypothetical protein
MPHGRMTGRHRLTIDPNQLLQPARHPRLGIRKRDPLGANAAAPTAHPPLRVDDRDRMRRPRQILPGAFLLIAHAPGAMPTPAAGVAAQAERIRDRNNKEENLRMFDSVCGASHPRYLIAC